jgi:hypothetical protein
MKLYYAWEITNGRSLKEQKRSKTRNEVRMRSGSVMKQKNLTSEPENVVKSD